MGDTGKNIIGAVVSITLAGIGVVAIYQVLTHASGTSSILSTGGQAYNNFFGTLMKG